MKKINTITGLLAAGLLMSSGLVAQTVKLTLAKGTRYEVLSTVKATSKANVMGQDMETNIDSKSDYLYQVKESRSTEFDISQTLSKMSLSATMMGQEMNYDSEKKDNNAQLAEAMGGEVGKTRNLTLNKDGAIVKTDAVEKKEGDMMTAMLSSAATGENEVLLVPSLLNRNLKVGDQWQDSSSTKTEKMTVKNTGVYTVKAIDKGIAQLSYGGMQQSTATMEMQGMELISNGNNKVSAELQVDMKTGVLIERKTTITLDVTVEAGGMSIPSTGTVTAVTTVKAM
jgi:hypothetical protein